MTPLPAFLTWTAGILEGVHCLGSVRAQLQLRTRGRSVHISALVETRLTEFQHGTVLGDRALERGIKAFG